MMDYYLALDPEMGVDAADFIEAWNSDPECVLAGKISPSDVVIGTAALAALGIITTVGGVKALVITVASAVAVQSVIYLVKKVAAKVAKAKGAKKASASEINVRIGDSPVEETEARLVAAS